MSNLALPTAAQVHATRQLIANRIREIESAQEQIRQHEAHIAALRSSIDGIHKAIAADEAYIAPVRRLPFEMLGEIIALVSTHPSASVQVLRHLGSVCRTWRHATLSTPKAWTQIHIYVPHDNDDTGRPRQALQTLQHVREWFERSGSCKKDVFLSGYAGKDQVFVPILEYVLSRCSEMRTFVPSVNLWDNAWAKHLSRPMPELRALDVSRVTLDKDLVSALARSSPHLSCLKVERSSADALVPLQHRLKSLRIEGITAGSLLCILRSGQGFSNLRALSGTLRVDHYSGPSSSTNTTSLSNLRILSLVVDDIAVPFLENLHMPRLESLALYRFASTIRPVTKKQVAEFLNFGANGDLPLRELRLTNFWISDADLLKLLKRTPELELLAILNGKTSDKVMDALSSKQPGKPARWLCPHLSRLCVISDPSSKSDKFRVSQEGIGALVTARLRANLHAPAVPPVARLTDVHLDVRDIVFGDALDGDSGWHFAPSHDKPRWWRDQSNSMDV